ncbi:MAG: hypothetical protein WCC63_03885 [Candidatus Bathyarchaeia archaeon]|jgi:hypothetical protein
MTKEAVVRQFFMDFVENLGYQVDERKEFEDEESNMILTDLFFAGKLEMKWNPKKHSLMLKPKITINIKEPQSSQSGTESANTQTFGGSPKGEESDFRLHGKR